jgi:serine phosphatase RsbU (regulator of sigma subunit)
MYRKTKKLLEVLLFTVILVGFSVVSLLLTNDQPFFAVFIISGAVFILFRLFYDFIQRRMDTFLVNRYFVQGESRLIGLFIDKIRFSFTISDFISAIREVLEQKIDSSVILMDMSKHHIIYNSSTILGMDPYLNQEIIRHYDSWKNGFFFFDDNLDLVSDHRKARGFFLVVGNTHCYVFMRFIHSIDREVFPQLYTEFENFLKRNETIEKMYAIAAVSKEWSMVAETQQSFLLKNLPVIHKVELASYFKPLVNVSGDYYDVLPLDDHRTLMILGDVSGKGLPAALIMGIVVNTIRVMEQKDDLELVVRTVDAAIKGMKLQDKYTVLFVGLLDTEKNNLTYVNASMADPMIISETGAGRQIRRLGSNCSIIGILELEDVGVVTVPIFNGDVILMASDGVSEVSGGNGEMLGDTEEWIDFILEKSSRPAQEFVDLLADFVMNYANGSKLRDDVTVLVAKIQE